MSCLCDSRVVLPSRPWYMAAWSRRPSGLVAPSEDTEADSAGIPGSGRDSLGRQSRVGREGSPGQSSEARRHVRDKEGEEPGKEQLQHRHPEWGPEPRKCLKEGEITRPQMPCGVRPSQD